MMRVERITVTLTADMAKTVKGAVTSGHFASNSEVVRETLRDWRQKQLIQTRELEALRQDIGQGLDDIEKGRVKDFDTGRIVAKGKKRSDCSE
ncbi:MAG: type II toxin-antitoxin system ParD family antitoxin [Proteobacteria bacterium]|nr:type II toxin-antitoxin system ParD family antitoxin [Pseudomonadota bacterium]